MQPRAVQRDPGAVQAVRQGQQRRHRPEGAARLPLCVFVCFVWLCLSVFVCVCRLVCWLMVWLCSRLVTRSRARRCRPSGKVCLSLSLSIILCLSSRQTYSLSMCRVHDGGEGQAHHDVRGLQRVHDSPARRHRHQGGGVLGCLFQ